MMCWTWANSIADQIKEWIAREPIQAITYGFK